MKGYKIVTKVEVVEAEISDKEEMGILMQRGSEFSLALSLEDAESIDTTESNTMDVIYKATRSALSEHFTALSKKK